MSKKIKEVNIDAAIDAIIENEPATEPEVIEVPEAKKVDLKSILAAMPDSFTPAILDKAFNLNDGGKTVRRHLRKNFAEAMTHNKKDKWTFSKAQTDILEYFATRYAFNAKALAK